MPVPEGFPQWLGWMLTAIVIPSGAYLANKFIEFMKFQQVRADEGTERFTAYLEKKDADWAALLRERQVDNAKERSEWGAMMREHTEELRSLRVQEREEMAVMQNMSETMQTLVKLAQDLKDCHKKPT